MPGETGHQADQESRSIQAIAARNVANMNLTIHYAFLPHTDPDAALAFYRDVLGFEIRQDVGYETMRWITVGPPGQPGTSIVLHPPAVDPGISDDERRTILELIAKGVYGAVTLATDDLDGTFARIEAAGADIVQEPTDQDYGVRDCAVRDPAGNLIRINQLT
ncbi:putative glyoxalase superfamily protein PhnB [Bogoriella caseilytica]|uniref:Putative glyoxalase superfamily protein PhnB n=2 Tax=Bogoriella caseilytica TaxID=56055 RepID=A0A3N2BFZ9_9MICO|nr:putative glyoxalase superfamily protein PhnB [Bogoriella caseilytica]